MDLLVCEPTQIKETLKEQGVRFCFSGYVDLHGRLKGKIVPLSHFDQMVKGSELYTGAALDGVPQEINDEEVSSHPDVAHGFILPWNKEVAFFPSNLYNQGKPFEACSRNILSRQVERAAKMGYKMNLGVETEFFILRDERESLARGERTQGAPTGVAGISTISDRDILDKPCYDVATAHDNFHWLIELVDAMDELGWDVYSFDHEDARSQFEIDFMYSDVLSMADRVAFFRYMAGDIARKHGYFASFMPKPFANMSGSGAHMNMSLEDAATGKNLFEAKTPEEDVKGVGLTQLAVWFIGGTLAHAPAICLTIAPTVNSYKRLVRQGSMSGSTWAPIFVSYGNNNRTNMLRVPKAANRVECRASDIAFNPYLGSALMLAAGLEGIEKHLDPGDPHRDNLHKYTAEDVERAGISLLPRDLGEACDAFATDPLAREVFGDAMFDSYLSYKRREWEEFTSAVTDWERDRYLTFF